MNTYGFDIETGNSEALNKNGKRDKKAALKLFLPTTKLLCASISTEVAVSYLHSSHRDYDNVDRTNNLTSLAIIQTILSNPENTIVAHNLQFDVTGWCRFYRTDSGGRNKGLLEGVKCKYFDTMIANYLLDPGGLNSLNHLAWEYFKIHKLNIDIENAPADQLLAYNGLDAILHYKLYEPLMNKLVDNHYELLFSYLMKVLRVLIKMQSRGVTLDLEYIRKHRSEVEDKIEEIESKLYKVVGEINLNSPKQLKEALYDVLDLPILHYTDKGEPSTSIDAITKLKASPEVSKKHKKVVSLLSDYRSLQKIHGTYLLPLEKEHLGYDNKIHTSYFLAKGFDRESYFGTISGRTSSSNPNLQNIPNTSSISELSVNVRRAFIPSSGYTFYKADYAQLEMRIAAYLSNDGNMQDVFRKGIDIHTYSLTGVYSEDYAYIISRLQANDEVWKERRLLIKNFNFAMIYGASPWKLQAMLLMLLGIQMDIEEVKRIHRAWSRLYPRFTQWRYAVHDVIAREGKVYTETGRKREFFNPEHHTISPKELAQFLREGLNDLIQSLGSDICVFGLVALDKIFTKRKLGRVLLLVHDSVDGEVKEDVDPKYLEKVCRKCMIDIPKKILSEKFELDVSQLYLDIDVKSNLPAWG